jgi:hypothetical protein
MTSTNYVTPVFNTASTTTSGDMVVFNNTNGTLIADSNIASSNLVTTNTTQVITGSKTFQATVNFQTANNQIELLPGGSFATFINAITPTTGTWAYSIQDIGQSCNFVFANAGPAVGDIALWDNTTGTLLEDSSLNVSVASTTTTLSTTSTAPILILTVPRQTTGAGSSITVQSGAAQSAASNTNGGDLVFTSGISTGTGRSNIKIKQSVGKSVSGTTDNAVNDRMAFMGRVTISNNTATNFVFPSSLASGDAMSLVIRYGVRVTGGSSDVQCETNTVTVSAINKAGTITSTVTPGTAVQTLSAGTLTTTWAVGASGQVSLTANSSLTTPVVSVVYDVDNMSSTPILFA